MVECQIVGLQNLYGYHEVFFGYCIRKKIKIHRQLQGVREIMLLLRFQWLQKSPLIEITKVKIKAVSWPVMWKVKLNFAKTNLS
jgi:uncharacterized membrane protein (Fun14 family)